MQDLATQEDQEVPAPARRKPWTRVLWSAGGTVFLALGILGIPLPLLPTTPFLLLASACYMKGAPGMHQWMMTNRYFGKYLADYRAGQGIPLAAKLSVGIVLWLAIGTSVVRYIDSWIGRIALIALGLGVTIHLVRIKTKKVQPTAGNISPETSDADLS